MSDDLQRLRRALGAIDRLEGRLAAYSEPIAVVGMGCRLPGGVTDPSRYWSLLRDGVDAVGELPEGRFATAPSEEALRKGGFLADIAGFDAGFFGISDAEAMSMDPQQRLLLEVAWEALEDAGMAADRAGTETGVFIALGGHSNDYAWLELAKPEAVGLHTVSGTFHSLLAGRLSYFLDLKGPNLVVDAACASSLAAIHLACQSLRARECDLGLVGAVNLILLPDISRAIARAGLLSPRGRCRTFDAAADGFVRGEGCAAVVLKRLSDATADGDTVLAMIRGSAVAQSGRSAGLTAPNGLAQQAVIRKALAAAGIAPEEVSYVEAHGTGTRLGDAIEAQALGEVLGHRRRAPFLLGSVKTNLGHLETVSGMASLLKVVLALRHHVIPPHLHLREVSPDIDLASIGAEIPASPRAWDAPRRIAGISAFGMNGTNAHLLVEEAPEVPPAAPIEGAQVLALSARSEPALRDLAARFAYALGDRERLCEGAGEPPSWADICASASVGRRHFEYRLAVVASSTDEGRQRLAAFVAGVALPGIHERGRSPTGARRDALDEVAQGYAQGGPIDWASQYPARHRRVRLPTYPFQRKRYWIEGTPEARPAPPQEPRPRELLHRLEFRPGATPEGPLPPGGWLVLSDREVGPALAERLRARGAPCSLVHPAAVDPARPEAFEELLRNAAPRNIVYLWPLSAEPIGGATLTTLDRDRRLICGGLLHLVQALSRRGEPARLWLVTRGAQDGEAAQAQVLGMATTLAVEHPELSCVSVDLDPKLADASSALLEELSASDGEDRVARRAEGRQVARLRRAPLPALREIVRPDATYLISGGFGGLGLTIAERLADRGARHLALLGRRPGGVEALEALRRRGVEVRAIAADIADLTAMEGVFRALREGMPALRGIVHAAGVLSDGLLSRQAWGDFAAAAPAKIDGAWNLHVLSQACPLDFFVLFSSATTLTGLPGAGGYAAANAFLDAFATFRRAQSLPAISIAWGAWAEIGMAGTSDGRRAEQWDRHGLSAFAVRDGLEVFDRLLGHDDGQAVVIALEKDSASARHRAPGRLLDDLIGREAPAAPVTSGPRDLLEEVQLRVRWALKIDPSEPLDAHRPLSEIGLDSLGAVELRNHLAALIGHALPVTLAFNYPSIAAIARFLSGNPPASAAPKGEDQRTCDVQRLEQLSESAAEQLLEEKLRSLVR